MPPQPLFVSAAGILCHLLDGAEGFLVDQRLMGVANDDPLGFLHLIGLPSLGKAGALAPLHHMAQIDLIGQNPFDHVDAPQRIGVAL